LPLYTLAISFGGEERLVYHNMICPVIQMLLRQMLTQLMYERAIAKTSAHYTVPTPTIP